VAACYAYSYAMGTVLCVQHGFSDVVVQVYQKRRFDSKELSLMGMPLTGLFVSCSIVDTLRIRFFSFV
jgi:hypothetical protein